MVCADCRSGATRVASFCSCCGKPADAQTKGTGLRLRWVGSFALLATSVWTGIAGGFGLYSRQVGATRAWTALVVGFAAVQSGKAFLVHPANAHPPAGHRPDPKAGVKPAPKAVEVAGAAKGSAASEGSAPSGLVKGSAPSGPALPAGAASAP